MPVGCGLASNPMTQRQYYILEVVAVGLGGLPELAPLSLPVVVIPGGVSNGNSLPLLLWHLGSGWCSAFRTVSLPRTFT